MEPQGEARKTNDSTCNAISEGACCYDCQSPCNTSLRVYGQMKEIGLRGLWLRALEMGAATFPRNPALGLKRLILPLSYWRSVEFLYAWNGLAAAQPRRVLDLGSPKDLALLLARYAGVEVVATDILPSAVDVCERFARAQGICGSGPGKVLPEVQDGRSLTYADDSFDAAFSVSVLEHIPDHDDTTAISELVRVVRPGGVVVVTAPYDLSYRETFVSGDVYERSAVKGEPVFFERHYDDASLKRRLLSIPGTYVADLQLWGERARVERFLSRLGPLRIPLSPFEVLLAAWTLHPVSIEHGAPRAVLFTLRKQG